jgi:hypothetical protein
MAKVLCYCGRYQLNPERATFVKNGVPMCHEWTCAKVKEHRKREHLDLSRVPEFDVEPADVSQGSA